MSINKLWTLINHSHDRRTSRKTHCWTIKLSEYDYLSYIGAQSDLTQAMTLIQKVNQTGKTVLDMNCE